jgi:hypothetical protein
MFIYNYYSIMYHKVARDNNNYKMTNLDGLHSNYDIKNNNYDTNRYNESSRPVVLTIEHTYTYTWSSCSLWPGQFIYNKIALLKQ